MQRLVLAMSGGVDSSVAAKLLKDSGHDLVGVFMRHGAESPLACESQSAQSANQLPIVTANRLDHKQGCCSASDAEDARQVAENLEIPFYALNLQKEFDRIIDYFVDEYSRGRTPNPCVMCNNWIKFGKLFAYADSVGAAGVATGHYAQIIETNGEFQLRRGVDTSKDQSYVLFGIDKSFLPRMVLPVGGYHKSQIRQMANEVGLRVADKRDSQEICFVTSGKHAEFVADRSQDNRSGEIVTTDGTVVGTHQGIEGFTIGQRKGLRVAMGKPYFVVRIEPDTCRVVIGEHAELGCDELVASQSNWLVGIDQLDEEFSCLVQIRYNSSASPATVRRMDNDRFHVAFERPCHGVAPGQAAVCYLEDRVLGGGWIESSA